MIFTENSYYYPDIGLSRQGSTTGKSGRNNRVGGESSFFNNISEAAGRASEKKSENMQGMSDASENISAQEEFSKNQGTVSELIGEATKADSKLSREDLLQIISEHREEILKKIRNGETGIKIPIGSLWLTEEEWEKLLDSFDEAQEEIQEAAREKSGEELPEKRPDTTINGNKVLAPEDTGHDLKSLEELAGESDVRGTSMLEGAAEGTQKTSAEEERLEVRQVQRQEQLRDAGVRRAEGFADYFPGMQVITKVGNCNVSSGIWCRTDFPFWEYFREGTSADALNDWQPSGPQPSMLDSKIQRNLSSIGAGKISILIPEKLQARMDADPAYAQEIYQKVAKWKEDYDAWDNAAAAGLGMNVAEHQLSKSYCVQLDEDGNVENFTVTSGGRITQSEKTVEDNWLRRRNAAVLFHKRHLAKMGYTGLTGTAGIAAEEGEDSPLSLLRAAVAAETLLMDEEKKKNSN